MRYYFLFFFVVTSTQSEPPGFVYGIEQNNVLLNLVSGATSAGKISVDKAVSSFKISPYLRALRYAESFLNNLYSKIAKKIQFQTSIDADPTVIFTNLVLSKVAANTMTPKQAQGLLNAASLEAADRPASLSKFTSITYPKRIVTDTTIYDDAIAALAVAPTS